LQRASSKVSNSPIALLFFAVGLALRNGFDAAPKVRKDLKKRKIAENKTPKFSDLSAARRLLQWKKSQKNKRSVAEGWSRLADEFATARHMRSIMNGGGETFNCARYQS
jgi:hypothetical protein